jgi:tetratricopeptide (TPR) repeat protein
VTKFFFHSCLVHVFPFSVSCSFSLSAFFGQSACSTSEYAVFKEGALRRLAGVFLGSALLVASLGLGLTRQALARAPLLSTTSQNEEATELDADDVNTEDALEGSESELASPQPAKEGEEEKKSPAELVLLSYLSRHPEDVKTLEGLLYVRLRNGSIADALETVDKLLALRPDHAPWQLIRAQSLEFLGDLEVARHAFEAILEKDPLSARALQASSSSVFCRKSVRI